VKVAVEALGFLKGALDGYIIENGFQRKPFLYILDILEKIISF